MFGQDTELPLPECYHHGTDERLHRQVLNWMRGRFNESAFIFDYGL